MGGRGHAAGRARDGARGGNLPAPGRGSPHGSQWEVRWYFASVHLAITCLTAQPPQKILASRRTRFQTSACVFLVYHRSRERGKISATLPSALGRPLLEHRPRNQPP